MEFRNSPEELRMTNELAEKVLPTLPIERFTQENSSRFLEIDQARLIDGVFLGWTRATGEHRKEGCEYLCMFELEGKDYWCHIGTATFRNIARKISGIDV
jgi:hypothetical protein